MKCPLCQNENNESFLSSTNIHGRYLIDPGENFFLLKCKNCGVFFLSGVTINEEYYKKYHEPGYYDQRPKGHLAWINRILSYLSKRSTARKEKFIIRNLGNRPKISILDIGCGSGEFLAQLDNDIFKKTGVEINPEGYELCRQKGLQVYGQEIGQLNFADKFEAITLWHVFEHLEKPDQMLRSIHANLNDDGLLVFQMPNASSLGFRLGKKYWFHLDSPRHLILYNRENIRWFLDKEGFEAIKIKGEFWDFPLDFFWSIYCRCRTGSSIINFLLEMVFLPLALFLRLFYVIFPDFSETITVVAKKKPDSSRMKILLVEPCWENFGGYFRAIGIAKNLAKRLIETTLIIPQTKGILSSTLEENSFLKIKKVKNKKQSFIDRLYRFLFIARDIRKNDYDVVHVFTIVHPEMILVLFFCKIIGQKVILDWDDYWQDCPIYRYGGWPVRAYIKFTEEFISRFVKFMTVTSAFLFAQAEKVGIKNIVKIVNGVDKNQFQVCSYEEAIAKLGYDKNRKYLITFGNTYENERTYLVLKTFERVWQRDKSIYLLVNLDLKEIAARQNKLSEFDEQLFNNIIVTGFIPPKDLGIYLAASKCVIFLTDNTPNELACFPIRVGSYLNGEKVIATTETNSEWCNTLKLFNCALIGKDVDDLANKILDFVNNEKLQKDMEGRVKIAKNELSWDNITASLVDFYKKSIYF